MDTRVSDRLAVFKQAESESKSKAQVSFLIFENGHVAQWLRRLVGCQ